MQLMFPVPSTTSRLSVVTLPKSALLTTIRSWERDRGGGWGGVGRHFYPGFYFYSLYHTSQFEAPFFFPSISSPFIHPSSQLLGIKDLCITG